MTLQFQHIFAGVRIRRRKIKQNSLIDDPAGFIEKITERGLTGAGAESP